MPGVTEDRPSQTGEFKKVEKEPRLEREPARPTTVPEIELPPAIGSTTGIMKIRREDDDETSQGDEDNPVEDKPRV